jgi:DNA-binding transcriptional ArsR family regulator/catechol 2,3-dioxygenase-like lactoylglutathione lyase family enzyme
MHPLTVLADPVRRRIVEVLADGERTAGELVRVVGGQFGISQSAVSQQLRVLRDQGFASARPEGARRVYALEATAIDAVDGWLEGIRGFWLERLDDLDNELSGRIGGPADRRHILPEAADAALPGAITHVIRSVRDLAESVAFYRAALGLPHLGTSGTTAAFDVGGTRLLLVERDSPTTVESVLVFAVADLPTAVERLRAAAITFRGPPHPVPDQPDGTEEVMGWFDDPEGRPLGIVTRTMKG